MLDDVTEHVHFCRYIHVSYAVNLKGYCAGS